MRERRLLERTLIVLAADDGEEMYEHGHLGHCRSIAYETVLKTPLVLRIPDAPSEQKGLRRDALAENLDIVPTLFDYLGLSTEGRGFEGTSLRPVIEENRRVRRVSFGLQGVARTIHDGTYKLSYDLASGNTKLFDLQKDPRKNRSLPGTPRRRPAPAGGAPALAGEPRRPGGHRRVAAAGGRAREEAAVSGVSIE